MFMSMNGFAISATVRDYPCLPYEKIKNDVLGKGYDLSLVFVGPTRARTLNQNHRGKSYVPNILSFPLESYAGEIIITPSVAYKEARNCARSKTDYIGFLFIHGLLHLKGYDHGDKMCREERRYLEKYSFCAP